MEEGFHSALKSYLSNFGEVEDSFFSKPYNKGEDLGSTDIIVAEISSYRGKLGSKLEEEVGKGKLAIFLYKSGKKQITIPEGKNVFPIDYSNLEDAKQIMNVIFYDKLSSEKVA